MPNKLLSLFFLLVFSLALFSQTESKCAISDLIKTKEQNDLEFAVRRKETAKRLANFATTKNNNSQVYTIPVVFHILHLGGSENISNDQVYDAMKHMNEDFRKRNEDTSAIVPEFKSIAADCEIEFKLATRDPYGNCTNGIIRHYTPSTNFDASYAYTGIGPGLWDPQKYMNIYVCRTLDYPGAAAYTYIPGWLGAGSPYDAIVSLHTYVGGIGTATQVAIHVLSHEVGHWLGLSHVWGDSNDPGVVCGDDGVFDTPITKGWQNCILSGRVCDPNILENVQNFMEYSYCDNMFTEGQKQRMRDVIATGANAGRDILVSNQNLIETGVVNPLVCAPIADFKTVSNELNYCAGQTIQFKDDTRNSYVTGWQWSFPGGTPSTSTDSMPIVVYTNPGIYPVSYTATNVSGSSTLNKDNYIEIVSNQAQIQNFYTEDFESISFPNAFWRVENYTNDTISWKQINGIGFSGNKCMMINNYNNDSIKTEVLYTPSFNLNAVNNLSSSSDPLRLTFKLAYQGRSNLVNEKLQVFSSNNCGQTWSLRYSKAMNNLTTTGNYSFTPFIPASLSDWRTEQISISSLLNAQHMLFKFQFTSDINGLTNNIYIDDINLSRLPVGLKSNEEDILDFNVFPNPTNGNELTINFNSYSKEKIHLQITDLHGKLIWENTLKTYHGLNQFTIDQINLFDSGIYFLKVTTTNSNFIKKLVINR